MAIDKAVNPAPDVEITVETEELSTPDIEIVLEEDGGAVIEIGDKEDDVDFHANLAEVIDRNELSRVSIDLMAMFDADKSSRQDWEQTYSKGLDLLGLKMEERTKPFRGSASAVHPMLTESVVQFQSQAFKELMPAGGPVRTQILGKETVDKAQQASRVKNFMNYQLTSIMEEYTPEMDQALFYLGYGGSVFKKVYFDEQLDRMVSKLVLPDDLYIPYTGSSVMSQCDRITHRIAMNANEFKKRVVAGEYVDYNILEEDYDPNYSEIQSSVDRTVGVSPTGEAEEVFLLEFHVDLDIEGHEDKGENGEPTGIKLPYVVTVEETSEKVVGIRRNYLEDDKLKKKLEYFVHYVLIEGLGAYGLGFVHLIGGLSKSSTAALRQLLDAGTLSNLPAGFKARGARIADNDTPIQPGEFRDIDAGGAELNASLMPLPYKEPSQTLFGLLGFLVDAGKRLANTADMQVGDGNQMAAVGTTIALLERGSIVMSAIHKRLHYAQSVEFKMLAKGFGKYLPDSYPYSVPGADRSIKKKDFDSTVDVLPVADPNIFSSAQRITLSQMQLEMAQSAPQMHNLYEAYYRVYTSLNVRDIDGVLIPQSNQMPRDPATENASVLNQIPLKAFAGQQHDAHILSHLIMGMSPIVQANPIAAQMLQQHIYDHIKLKAEEEVEAELFKDYGVDPDKMVSSLQKEGMIAIKVAEFLQEVKETQAKLSGQGPDPVVALKEKELELRAQDDQMDNQIAVEKLKIDQSKVQQTAQNSKDRIQSQEAIAGVKAQLARERLEQADRNNSQTN
jgi:chaperonin GroES